MAVVLSLTENSVRRLAVALLGVGARGRAWTWPASGPVLGEFNLGDDPYAGGQHRGIDVGGAAGEPVLAPRGGAVSFAGSVPTYGLAVTIATDDGYSVTLVHLGSIGVKRGGAVEEGDVVGTIGPGGDARLTLPYVHLGVRVDRRSERLRRPAAVSPRALDPRRRRDACVGALRPMRPAAPAAEADPRHDRRPCGSTRRTRSAGADRRLRSCAAGRRPRAAGCRPAAASRSRRLSSDRRPPAAASPPAPAAPGTAAAPVAAAALPAARPIRRRLVRRELGPSAGLRRRIRLRFGVCRLAGTRVARSRARRPAALAPRPLPVVASGCARTVAASHAPDASHVATQRIGTGRSPNRIGWRAPPACGSSGGA